jgi:hypothetical protein
MPPLNKKRLMLEFEYSNSLFGSDIAAIEGIVKKKIETDDINFKSMLHSNQKLLSRYK